MNARKEQNIQGHPDFAFARPIPGFLCRVNAAGATSDFPQQDKLDYPSCGDAMRPEGETVAAEAEPAVVFR